jgi:hypothetical protein
MKRGCTDRYLSLARFHFRSYNDPPHNLFISEHVDANVTGHPDRRRSGVSATAEAGRRRPYAMTLR